MNADLTSQSTSLVVASADEPTLELAIAAWLHAKQQRSKSERTIRAYDDTLTSFRAVLRMQHLDLDSGDMRKLALLAQAWASHPSPSGQEPAPATVKHRLDCVSSFYEWAPRLLPDLRNPISRVDRPVVHPYTKSRSLDEGWLRSVLVPLRDERTPLGRRDYALLLVALTTGKRLSELASLTIGDIERAHGSGAITLDFKRVKGGAAARRTLGPEASLALTSYLALLDDLVRRRLGNDEAIWRALDHRSYLRPLSKRGIGVIVERRLGTTHVHALRHTFARTMLDAGADIETIRDLLGHANIGITGTYLRQFKAQVNPFIDSLETRFVSPSQESDDSTS